MTDERENVDRTGRDLARLVWPLTIGRFSEASLSRMLGPLIVVIAVGLDASIVELGAAIAVFESAGLLSPVVGWAVDRFGPRSMALLGLTTLALFALVAATASTVLVFGVLLAVAGIACNTFESAATAWVSVRSEFRERARWLGRLDLAWPAGLLIGLPAAGLVSLWSWRAAFVGVGLIAAGTALRLRTVLDQSTARPLPSVPMRWTLAAARGGLSTIVAFAAIATAIQIVIVVFGVWLGDEFGFSTAAIGAVGFALGLAELSAGVVNIRFTDRIGKSTAAVVGAAGLVVAATALAVSNSVLGLGIAFLAAAVAGHEFALVATKPLLAEIDPPNPGLGIGLGFGLAAMGRGAGAIGGTWLYTNGGMTYAATAGAVVALIAAGTYLVAVNDPARTG